MDALRRTTLLTTGACAAVAMGLGLLFWVILEPATSVSCNSSLLDGPYKTALVPAHVAAAAVLTAVLWSGDRRARWALGVVWLYVGICLVENDAFGPLALFGVFAPWFGAAALVALAINAGLDRRWERLARLSRVLAWGCLLLGLPASLTYAYLDGASLFCF